MPKRNSTGEEVHQRGVKRTLPGKQIFEKDITHEEAMIGVLNAVNDRDEFRLNYLLGKLKEKFNDGNPNTSLFNTMKSLRGYRADLVSLIVATREPKLLTMVAMHQPWVLEACRNEQNQNGTTALHIAELYGQAEMIKILKDHGYIELPDEDHRLPKHYREERRGYVKGAIVDLNNDPNMDIDNTNIPPSYQQHQTTTPTGESFKSGPIPGAFFREQYKETPETEEKIIRLNNLLPKMLEGMDEDRNFTPIMAYKLKGARHLSILEAFALLEKSNGDFKFYISIYDQSPKSNEVFSKILNEQGFEVKYGHFIYKGSLQRMRRDLNKFLKVIDDLCKRIDPNIRQEIKDIIKNSINSTMDVDSIPRKR